MNAVSLLPCPFCGSNGPHAVQLDTEGWAVICPECGVIGPIVTQASDAAIRWNRRLPQLPGGQ